MVLSAEEKKLKRKEYYEKNKEKLLQKRKAYRENNKEHIAEYNKEYYEKNKEKLAEYDKNYNQTANGKKRQAIGKWKCRGLIASQEDFERIYSLYLNQELCNACDIKLTRNGNNSATDATMDHDHITNKFRHIICRSCNCQDKWMDYFC